MTNVVLKASPRGETGSAAARRLRRAGRVPAILYGQGRETVHLSVDGREFQTAMRRRVRVVDLDLEGEIQQALIRETQTDVYGDAAQHVDFQRIVVGERIETQVSLSFFGTPKGVLEQDGVLETAASIEVECLASAIPDSIEVDVRALAVGDRVRVQDLVLPEGVIALDDPERIVVAVAEAAEEEEEIEAAAEGPAEPEVIGRPVEEEEEK